MVPTSSFGGVVNRASPVMPLHHSTVWQIVKQIAILCSFHTGVNRYDKTRENSYHDSLDARDGTGGARHHDCWDGDAKHCRKIGRDYALLMGVFDLPADIYHYGSYLWQAGGPLRAQAALHLWHDALSHRLRSLPRSAIDGAVDYFPCHSGPRGGRGPAACADYHRRYLCAGGACQGAGAL